MKKLILIGMAIYFFATHLNAMDSVSVRTAQVTFAYPLGSSGMNSIDYANNFSFNILYGLNGGLRGVEIGSLLNYNRGTVTGIQVSGIANVNTGHSSGVLVSGVATISLDSSRGILVAGVCTYSQHTTHGIQLSTLNFTGGTVNGMQIGVINYAEKLNGGLQVGVINYLDEKGSGLPIGLISIVKNGLFGFELGGGETFYSTLTYRMGVEKLYTLYKAGYSTYKSKPVYSYGLGFGTSLHLADRHKAHIDLSTNLIVYNGDWSTTSLNMLHRADVLYHHTLFDNVALMAGPSLNVYVTENKIDGEFGTLSIPYSIYSHESSNRIVKMWVGLTAGIAVKL